MSFQRCIILLVDGSRPDVFEELVGEGRLPNIESLFQTGGRFTPAVSVFPSTTGPAYVPFLTGLYPGTANVPGIRWFDKFHYALRGPLHKRFRSYVGLESFLLNHDIELNTPTLYEYFKNPASIFSPVSKGCKLKQNKTIQSRIWYWYYAHLTDRWNYVDEVACQKLLSSLSKGSDFAFVVFPAIDEYSHFSHPRSEQTLLAYENLDCRIGEIISHLKKEGIFEETLIALVSDHGLSSTQHHFGLASFLENKNLKTFYYPKILKWGFEAVSAVSGNGMAHLYFKNHCDQKGREAWQGRAHFEYLEQKRWPVIEELLAQEAVDLLAAQNLDSSVEVFSKRGRANISIKENRIYYQVKKNDPFGFPVLPSSMTEEESLTLTFNTAYPDALMQLLQIFRSRRTGDCVISAAKSWDLRKRYEYPEHRSSHGGLIAEHMKIPFYINAPISSKPCRSVDVFPTILSLLGKAIPEGIDGKKLI